MENPLRQFLRRTNLKQSEFCRLREPPFAETIVSEWLRDVRHPSLESASEIEAVTTRAWRNKVVKRARPVTVGQWIEYRRHINQRTAEPGTSTQG